MTRWLLLFFVLVMPLQFAWSASAVYCEHGSAPSALHFGHHAHVHQDKDAQPGASSAGKAGAASAPAHPDCAYCHTSVVQAPMELLSAPGAPYAHSVQHPARTLYAFRIDPDIDRPKWARAG